MSWSTCFPLFQMCISIQLKSANSFLFRHFILFIRKAEREREMKRNLPSSPSYPNACNRQGCIKLNPGARSSAGVSLVLGKRRRPEPLPVLPSRAHEGKRPEIEAEAGHHPRYSDLGCRYPRGHQLLHQMATPIPWAFWIPLGDAGLIKPVSSVQRY